MGSLAGRIWLAGFLAACSYAICRTPLLPLLARDLGASAPALGLIVGASTITGILLKLPAGGWSDVTGRRPFLIAGGVVFAVMPFAYMGLATLGALGALRVAHGSATAIFNPVVSAGVSDIAPPSRSPGGRDWLQPHVRRRRDRVADRRRGILGRGRT